MFESPEYEEFSLRDLRSGAQSDWDADTDSGDNE
jgi:hypothetical protein